MKYSAMHFLFPVGIKVVTNESALQFTDSKVLVLLIQNKGDSKLKVDLTTSSSRNKHKILSFCFTQVNVSLTDSGINEVILNAGNGQCVLHLAGGVFACCCWFKKRKGQRDIPYQELEMSMPESAVAVESAEGWMKFGMMTGMKRLLLDHLRP
ncbi:Cysteine--tRNA ligase [Bienertia sinuspersici]